MDQEHELSTGGSGATSRIALIWQRRWVHVVVGALGWLVIAPLVAKIPQVWGPTFRTINLVLLAVLLLRRRTRLTGIGMGAAIALNFLAASFIATMSPPSYLTPLLGTGDYKSRWKFHNHYVAKDISPQTFVSCIDKPPDGRQKLTLALETWVNGYPEIHLIRADGSDEKNLSNHPGKDMHAAWSPDGTHIAFVSLEGEDGMRISVMNADGTERTQLTEGSKLADLWPSWSPDGRQIAFMTNRAGNFEIFVMNADGSGMLNLTRHPKQDSSPAWSPDGTKIAFTSDRDNSEDPLGVEIYVMDADGSHPRRITPAGMVGFRPAWSPNSKCIVYQEGAGLDDWIMLARLDGSIPVRLVHAGSNPTWSPDGRYISYSVIHGEWDFELYLLYTTTVQSKRITFRPWHDAIAKWKPIQ